MRLTDTVAALTNKRQAYGSKGVAVGKCADFYPFHAIRNNNDLQAAASLKCATADPFDGAWDINTFKICASLERIISDLRYSLGNGNAFKRGTIFIITCADLICAVRYGIGCNLLSCNPAALTVA